MSLAISCSSLVDCCLKELIVVLSELMAESLSLTSMVIL